MTIFGKKYKPKSIISAIVLMAVAVFLYLQREKLGDAVEVAKQIDRRYLFIIPLIGIINNGAISVYYHSALSAFSEKTSWREAWATVWAMNFVNQVLPSGGVSGITYIVYVYRGRVETVQAAISQLGRYVFSTLSYVLLLAASLILSSRSGSPGLSEVGSASGVRVTPRAAGIIVAALVGLVYVFSSRTRAIKLVRAVINSLDALLRPLLKRDLVSEGKIESGVNDAYDSVIFLFKDRKRGLACLLSMLVSTTLEIAIVYVSLRAVGIELNFAAVLMAVTVSNFVGALSIVPGDVGIYEATAVAALSAFGVEQAAALPAVLLYRVYMKALFLPVGYFFYNKGIRRKKL